MRSFLVLVTVLGSAGTALADSSLPPIDAASIPGQCAAVAQVPPSATIPQPAIAARIALASCGAEVRFNALQLSPGEASIPALADAAKASLALLDAAIQQNDPTWTPIAQKARTDLFESMVVRARNSIPAITMQTVGAPLAEHDQLHAALEPKLKQWIDQAH